MTDKPNLYLDLDNTLISAVDYKTYAKLSEEDKELYKEILGKPAKMDNVYMIYKRPYLDEFLDYIFKHYNVSIWTAASKNYALFIYDNVVIPDSKMNERNLNNLLFSYHCNISKKTFDKSSPKKLKLLSKIYNINLKNTMIIDDHPDVYTCQKLNCIRAEDFDLEESSVGLHDDFLKRCLEAMKKYKNETDITILVKNINEYTKKPIKKTSETVMSVEDDGGERKICPDCKDEFITYSSKAKCPECR